MSSERVMRLGLTISAKQSQLTISKDVIRILGSPSYVCVLQGKDKQSVAVACCEASHPMSFKVPENLLMDNIDICTVWIIALFALQILMDRIKDLMVFWVL